MSSSTHKTGRRLGIPLSLVAQRRACIVGLYLAGFSTGQILNTICNLSSVFGWGNISIRQVQRCLRQHFDGRPLTPEEVKSASHVLREAALAQMERCQEEVALYGYDQRSKNTKQFLEAMQTQAYIIQSIINFHGCNMSAEDYGKWNAGTPIPMHKFKRSLEFAGGRSQVLKRMIKEYEQNIKNMAP